MTDREFQRHLDRLDHKQAAISVGPFGALLAAGLAALGAWLVSVVRKDRKHR